MDSRCPRSLFKIGSMKVSFGKEGGAERAVNSRNLPLAWLRLNREHIPCAVWADRVSFRHSLTHRSHGISSSAALVSLWGGLNRYAMQKANRLSLWLLTCLASISLIAPLTAAPSVKQPSASERWTNLEKADSPSFRRHVVPLMSRSGCSGRECHGSFSGQGGFQLSLFGYDFEKDHKEITDDQEDGVRVDKKDPPQSLILLKATNEEHHKGKERIKKGSWEYNLILKWISEGAKIDVAETGEFERLEVLPKEIVFKKTDETVQLRVLAHWKDGTVEDVTQITRFRTNDDTVSNVSDTGEVKCTGPGDTHIVAFYDNGVHPIPVMLPVSDKVGPKYPKIVTNTKVDELVLDKLRKVGIVPSDKASDTEFLRRVSLDVTGTLPTPSEVREFVADKSADKRAKKIDELLNRPAYAAWWATQMCDWTGNNAAQLRGAGEKDFNTELSRLWYDWIEARIAKNEPYDKLVAGIVLATGRTSPDQSYLDYAKEMSSYLTKNHPADIADRPNMPFFWLRQNVRKPQEKALAFAHSFLGVRIECAECHKHPFDQWTKNDFQQFQAFFEPISYGANSNVKETVSYKSMAEKLREETGETDKKKQKKAVEAAFEKLVRAGEPAPWQELFVKRISTRKLSDKEIAKLKQKNPNYNSRVATPKILGGEEVSLTDYPDPRAPLMDWMRDPQNAYFARSYVNRVWANYFGRGIVEPADDMNLANPPVNKELMDYLAEGFVAKGFDMKWLHREILNSDTYQRTWKPNDTNRLDEKNFSHMVLRRLPAEVAMDAIALATTSSQQQSIFAGDIEKRAIGPNVGSGRKGQSGYALTTFGKPARLTNCDCERTSDPTLLQTLFTRNDPELLTKLEGSSKDNAWITELRRMNGSFSAEEKKADGELRKARATRQNLKKRKEMALAKGNAKPEELKKVDELIAATEAKEKELTGTPKAPAFNQEEVIQEIYLRTVSRFPTADEMAKAKEDLASAKDPVDGVRDVLWAMLNAREFLVNH